MVILWESVVAMGNPLQISINEDVLVGRTYIYVGFSIVFIGTSCRSGWLSSHVWLSEGPSSNSATWAGRSCWRLEGCWSRRWWWWWWWVLVYTTIIITIYILSLLYYCYIYSLVLSLVVILFLLLFLLLLLLAHIYTYTYESLVFLNFIYRLISIKKNYHWFFWNTLFDHALQLSGTVHKRREFY